MRFFKYKCPKSSTCAFTWGEGEKDHRCIYCGVNHRDMDTIWDSIQYKYWCIVPYHLRPGNLWYAFKCWAWRRHTTIKPRYLNHQWCDRSHLLPHMVFEILCDFVENELIPNEYINWEWNEEHSGAKREMLELYDWWINKYDKDTLDPTEEQKLLDNCQRVIKVSPFMWT